MLSEYEEEQKIYRVLIIEDDVQASTFLKEVMMMKGFNAVVANDSSKAVPLAELYQPDIVLTDLMMPDPDGYAICRMLAHNPKTKHIPIIVVTALADDDSRIVALAAGATEYVIKPFRIDELVEAIQKLLRRKRLGIYDEE